MKRGSLEDLVKKSENESILYDEIHIWSDKNHPNHISAIEMANRSNLGVILSGSDLDVEILMFWRKELQSGTDNTKRLYRECFLYLFLSQKESYAEFFDSYTEMIAENSFFYCPRTIIEYIV